MNQALDIEDSDVRDDFVDPSHEHRHSTAQLTSTICVTGVSTNWQALDRRKKAKSNKEMQVLNFLKKKKKKKKKCVCYKQWHKCACSWNLRTVNKTEI
jgi:hypothetical protein